ncbi:MAG: permease-like cell division protein FtsX [Proteobacteria bacterium]|nr:permease-like cell division protein FtsX [Pseudomonadota bacterium]
MILKVVWKHIRSRPISGVFTLMAISMVLTLLGSFWTLVENLNRVQKDTSAHEEKSSLTIFVKPDANNLEITNLKKSLSSEKLFENIRVISQEDALKELQGKYGETLSKALNAETLPGTIKIDISQEGINHEAWKSLIADIRKNPLVLDVDDGRVLFSGDSENSIPQTIINWASILFFIVFAIVALLVSHLIRLVFETSRKDIETMKILGASRSWIFLPLLLEGLIYGALGSLCSLIFLWISITEMLPRIANSLLPHHFDVFFLSTSSWLGIVGVALGASLLGALLTWPLVSAPAKEIA